METLEEKVGYLLAKVEEQGTDLKAVAAKVDNLVERVDEKFKTAEATFRVLKWVGALTVAALTFQFGGLSRIWTSWFH